MHPLSVNVNRTIKQKLRISIAITTVLIIIESLNHQVFIWGFLTTIGIYIQPGLVRAGEAQGVAIRRTLEITIGTIVGILFGCLYCIILARVDYRWAYPVLSCLFGFLYFSSIPNQYVTAAMCLGILAIVVKSIVNPPYTIDIRHTAILRIFYALLSVTIVIFCEHLIYPKANIIGDSLPVKLDDTTQVLAKAIQYGFQNFITHPNYSNDLSNTSREYFHLYSSIKRNYQARIYELHYTKETLVYYESIFEIIDNLTIHVQQLLALCVSMKSIVMNDAIGKALIDLAAILSERLKSISHYNETNHSIKYDAKNQVEFLISHTGLNSCDNAEIVMLIDCSLTLAASIDTWDDHIRSRNQVASDAV